MPEPNEFSPGDPKPVYDGDWQSASGSEKGQHSQRVRRWREAQGGVAQSGMAASKGQPAQRVPTPDATRAVLIAIRDDGNAHDSDRIRAAQALTSMEREDAAQSHGPSPLVALRHVLDTLQPHERLAWLQGERIAHVHAVEHGVQSG